MRSTSSVVAAILLISLVSTSPAQAGPYGDDLAKCLVESSTSQEKAEMVRWMFVAMSAHPAVKDLSPITTEKRDAANKMMAGLITRLLTETCRDKADKAVRYEGQGAIQSSFGVLGQVAAKEIFDNSDVAAVLGELGKYVDAKKIAQLGKTPSEESPQQ